MKVRIDEVGYENYTGQLGMLVFENGVSISDVSENELNRMSVVVRLIDAENVEKQVGSLVDYNKNIETKFPTEKSYATEREAAMVNVGDDIPTTVATEYSKEQLEALADKEGINGLREVATPLNVKGTSIGGLIENILNALSLRK